MCGVNPIQDGRPNSEFIGKSKMVGTQSVLVIELSFGVIVAHLLQLLLEMPINQLCLFKKLDCLSPSSLSVEISHVYVVFFGSSHQIYTYH